MFLFHILPPPIYGLEVLFCLTEFESLFTFLRIFYRKPLWTKVVKNAILSIHNIFRGILWLKKKKRLL